MAAIGAYFTGLVDGSEAYPTLNDAAKEALAKVQAAKAKAEAAAEEEYKAIAAEVKAETAKADAFFPWKTA